MYEFEKLAEEDVTLAEEILKVAADTVDDLTEDELVEDLLNELAAEGYDLDDPEVAEEVGNYLAEGLHLDDATEKAAEYITEDILKVAAGVTTGYETEAASRAVGNYFNLDGVANMGSAYGSAPVNTGSAISGGADRNVHGGYGTLMGQSEPNAHALNATSKLSGVLAGNYSASFKSASDNSDIISDLIDEAAYSEGQSVEDYLMDVGYEALEEEILDTLDN